MLNEEKPMELRFICRHQQINIMCVVHYYAWPYKSEFMDDEAGVYCESLEDKFAEFQTLIGFGTVTVDTTENSMDVKIQDLNLNLFIDLNSERPYTNDSVEYDAELLQNGITTAIKALLVDLDGGEPSGKENLTKPN